VHFVVKNTGLKRKRSELEFLFCPLSLYLGEAIVVQTFLIFKVEIFATHLLRVFGLAWFVFWGVLFGRWELRNNLNKIAYAQGFVQRKAIVSKHLPTAPS